MMGVLTWLVVGVLVGVRVGIVGRHKSSFHSTGVVVWACVS